MKAQANMALKISGTDRAIPLADFAADIARRREAAGIVDVTRNSGTRRTASKRALLKAIEDAGGKW
jgi:hypothetical protein